MRLPYQFNEIGDPKGNNWGRDAAEMTWEFVHYRSVPYQGYSIPRGIEDQAEILSKAIGGLAEVLISKGLMSPQEFIEAIGAKHDFEVRERNNP